MSLVGGKLARHAYLIAAHDNDYVVKRLLGLLDDPRNDIFIHVDKRAKNFDVASLSSCCRESMIEVIPRRRVFWGHFSQIDATLDLFREAIRGSHDYYHLISGADLPIKTQDEIHAFFASHQGKEFVGFAPDYNREWVSAVHPLQRFVRIDNRLARRVVKIARNFLCALQRRAGYDHTKHFDIEIRKGSDWYSITHELAEYLLENEKLIRRLLRWARSPTEFYMQTLVWNSDFRSRVFCLDDEYKGSARLIDWKRGIPYVFTSADLEELLSSDRMFARKFLAAKDRIVVDQISEHLLALTQ